VEQRSGSTKVFALSDLHQNLRTPNTFIRENFHRKWYYIETISGGE
jgi:hypothetical protein